MSRALAALLLLALLAPGCLRTTDTPITDAPVSAPYAGQQTREIKALSTEEIEGYRTGAGLGYAKSAELNHYPGPLHALQLAEDLALTQEQHAAISALRALVLERAIPLGERYLEKEAAIEDAFRTGAPAEELRARLQDAAAVEAELRFVHLDAHIATRALLTAAQIERYDALRGYTTPPTPEDANAHDGHGH